MSILSCLLAPIAKPTPPSFVARAEGKLPLPFVAPLLTKRKGRLPGSGHVFQQIVRTLDKFDLRHLADLNSALKPVPMKIALPRICKF